MPALERSREWLPAAPKPGIAVFTTLFFFESMARASVATLVPLQAYALLGDAQLVSYLSLGASGFGLIAGLMVPLIVRLFSRRWTYTLGGIALAAAALALATETIAGQVIGMGLRSFGSICLNVTLALYIMDYLSKHQFVRIDSVRMTFATVSWSVSPFLGVVLYERYGGAVAYGWSVACAAAIIALFWYFRLRDPDVLIPAKLPPANPFDYIPRFIAQPRLRLAWLIAFGRSSFWTTFFIYGPILIKQAGLPNEAAGLLISASQLMLLSAVLWGGLAERIGLRKTITLCFAGMALMQLPIGLSGSAVPWLTVACLLATALFAIGLDAVGGVTFYRACRPRERAAMTSVYRTYLEVSDLLPNLVYAVALLYFGVGAVFVLCGLSCLVYASICWQHLPKSL
jgi:MFS family permease